jgi:ribosomal-protein-alanine N-acetyltransferase
MAAPSDARPIAGVLNDREFSRNTGSIPFPYTTKHAEAYIHRIRRVVRKGEQLGLTMAHRRTRELLGGIGLHNLDWTSLRAEIGYWVGRANWGRGYASEAVSAVCKEAFGRLHLHRIEANVFPFNLASARVLSHVGFVKEGLQRERVRKGRIWLDVESYSLLASDFKPYKRDRA